MNRSVYVYSLYKLIEPKLISLIVIYTSLLLDTTVKLPQNKKGKEEKKKYTKLNPHSCHEHE